MHQCMYKHVHVPVYHDVLSSSPVAYNPKSSEYIRKKYKKKLAYFEERCGLISYLSSSMSHGYQEPAVRPIDFNHKMENFLGLKQSVF